MRFIFGYGVVVYFIMQSSFEKISKNAPCFHSQRGYPPPTIVFILTAAAAITPIKKSYEIAAMTMHSFVNSTFVVLLFLSVTLHNNVRLHFKMIDLCIYYQKYVEVCCLWHFWVVHIPIYFKLLIGRFINIRDILSNHDFSAIVSDYLKEAINRMKLQYYCEITSLRLLFFVTYV